MLLRRKCPAVTGFVFGLLLEFAGGTVALDLAIAVAIGAFAADPEDSGSGAEFAPDPCGKFLWLGHGWVPSLSKLICGAGSGPRVGRHDPGGM